MNKIFVIGKFIPLNNIHNNVAKLKVATHKKPKTHTNGLMSLESSVGENIWGLINYEREEWVLHATWKNGEKG